MRRDRTGIAPLDRVSLDGRTLEFRVDWGDGRAMRPARARPSAPAAHGRAPPDMILNDQAIELAFKGFETTCTDASTRAPVAYDHVAMTVTSSARDETYGRLGQFPQLREWLGGERVVRDLEAHGARLVNRTIESAVAIRREGFEDDRLGVSKPMSGAEMGLLARRHPDRPILSMLNAGFTLPCYGGQNFFDAEHPAKDADALLVAVPGVQAGPGTGPEPAWFPMDTSRAIRPPVRAG